MKYIPSWFPGNNFKAYAKEVRLLAQDLIRVPFENYKRHLVSFGTHALPQMINDLKAAGNVSACFVGDALGDLGEMSDPTLLDDVKKIAASMYAGTDNFIFHDNLGHLLKDFQLEQIPLYPL